MSTKRNQDLVKSVKNKGKNLEGEMSFFDHLAELRVHLIRASVAVIFFTIICFIYYDFIFDTVIMGPHKPSFWTYRAMCRIGEYFNMGPGFCITNIPGKIINTEMAGQFTLQINSALMTGLVLGFPYLLWEVWRFVKPALKDNERKSASGFVFYASLLFIVGLLFGYFIVAPLSVNFLSNYSISPDIENTITIDSYFSSVATLTLCTGAVFELPIVIYILSQLGVMTPSFMRDKRRYAVIIILVIAAIVTPTPDIPTMLTVSFPLFLLYELSIHVSARVQKKKEKAEREFFAN
ncbi:twin arginine-targeting protein translocase TatC [Pelobium manganitolerans]|uniref:Sec-independent protein translocase protein TatC n=1 Tax=Pelobium manganitolerans TaxID=1842495 RepID=A0A419SCE1_9SPHI|nr:twin-arginine translocase subunit TatC [Pelobium manganitolerans]RKD20457.1 twin arginine-targeting protein translocase TatC [Pelobium manganitolerans]